MTRIEWTRKALKQAAALDKARLPGIMRAVESLVGWPDCPNVKALKGREGYRLRVGRYRVLFAVHEGSVRIILVEEVKKRDERTY